MRLNDDCRRLVVFLGLRTTDKDGTIVPQFAGTGFFVSYPAPTYLPALRISYLVTARHVAEGLVGPFVIGVNNSSGALELCDVDEAVWQYHWDTSIDVAVVPMEITDADWQPFPYEAFADHENSALFSRFGVGDSVYVVGLYRLFPGKNKIFPIVHTGHVAMIPNEDIPVRNRTTGKISGTRGYLIEAQTLEGLSGSPVFVRYTNPTGIGSAIGRVVAYSDSIYLLGIWQSAWDGIAGDILSEQMGRDCRVPAGMGVAIPARRITEILESKNLREQREALIEQYEANAAATTGSPS
jgi:Trypsin-like peptidase domain